MSIVSKNYTGNGTTTIFSSDFDVISESHIEVLVNGSIVSKNDYDTINNAAVFTTAPVDGATVVVRVGTTPDDLLESTTNIDTVAQNISDIGIVEDNIDSIVTTATNASAITTTATNIANVNTVAGIGATGLQGIVDNVDNIETVSNIYTQVGTVAGISQDIATVAANDTNITTVATNTTNVNTVAAQDANITAIGTDIIPNITEILQADTNAATATTKAAEASTSATAAAASASSASSSATDAANSAVEAASYTPSQTGNAGKFLTTDGSDASWAEVVGVEHYSQETEPTPQSIGATWYKPSTNFMYIYVNDGVQDLWLDISTIGGGDTNLDGGSASTVYTTQQSVDGGNA